MGKIRGIPVTLITKEITGYDPLGEPITEDIETVVDNVIVSPTSQDDIVSNLDELEMKRLQITLRSDVLERLDVLALEMGVKRSVVLSLLINEKWKEEHTD